MVCSLTPLAHRAAYRMGVGGDRRVYTLSAASSLAQDASGSGGSGGRSAAVGRHTCQQQCVAARRLCVVTDRNGASGRCTLHVFCCLLSVA